MFRQTPSRQAFFTAGAPILGLVLLVIAGAFVVFFNFAQQQDRSYEDSTRRLVGNTIDERLHALSDLTLDYANWTDAYHAISTHWNSAWVSANFYSSAADAMVIFRGDGTVRYIWKANALNSNATALAYQIVGAARDTPALRALARAPHSAGTVTRTLALIDGQPAVIAIAAIEPEDDRERLNRPANAPVDYLAAVDILGHSEVAAIGRQLDLREFNFARQVNSEADLVSHPVRAANGALLGYVMWRNQHPGSAMLARELGPVVAGVLFVGILSVLLALALTQRQVRTAVRMQAALESSRLKSEFISNMSHELRTPLDAIIGYAELIDEEAPRSDLFASVRADAKRICDSAGKLRRLIDDVLDHSRIDAGHLQLTPEPILVSELFGEIDDALGSAARAQHDKLIFTCEDERLALTCDHQRLRQCLLNLAENSIRFTRNGGIEVSAACGAADGRQVVVFEVKDTGTGVLRSAAATMFEPFTQMMEGAVSASARRGGTLSLSIVRKLARAMGGDVSFEGGPSGGARFTLQVPQNAPAALARAA